MQNSRFICRSCLAAFRGERRISTRRTLIPTSSSGNSPVSASLRRSRSYTSTPQLKQKQINPRLQIDSELKPRLSYATLQSHFYSPWQTPETRKPFSTSSPHQRAILNPRKDEDGKDMDIEITDRATKVRASKQAAAAAATTASFPPSYNNDTKHVVKIKYKLLLTL